MVDDMKNIILVGMVFLLFFGCISQDQTENQVQNQTEPQEQEEAEVVEAGDYVEVEYTGTLNDGTVFDSNVGGDPLGFTAGTGQMIKGFDDAVIGMKVGEEKEIHLEPEEAYGQPDPELIMEFSLDNVPEGTQIGDVLFTPSGAQGMVINLINETAIVDFNFPLAGIPLNFKIKILEIVKG